MRVEDYFGPVASALYRKYEYWLSRQEHLRDMNTVEPWLDGYLAAIDEAIGAAYEVEGSPTKAATRAKMQEIVDRINRLCEQATVANPEMAEEIARLSH